MQRNWQPRWPAAATDRSARCPQRQAGLSCCLGSGNGLRDQRRRHRWRQAKALRALDAGNARHLQFRTGFDAFGNQHQVERVAKIGGDAEDVGRSGICRRSLQERTRAFQRIDRQPPQPAER